MVVAENEEIAVPVGDQRPQGPAAAVVYVLFSAAVLLGVVIVGIASGRAHLDVAGLGGLILQAGTRKPSSIEENVKRRGRVSFSGGLSRHEDRWSRCGQGAK